MSSRSIKLTDKLYRYLISVSLSDDALLRRLRRETERHPMGGMQISPEQGQFLGLLIELLAAKKAIEIGTFTGYSSLSMARALPADGRLICCDVSAEYTAVARKYWQAAGVASKVRLELGPALLTLDRLLAAGEAGSFDFAFIDADKTNYRRYYERCFALVRPGGLIAIDNVLWSGRPADARQQDADTRAIRAFNRHLHKDRRVLVSMLPMGDGLTLALKRRS